MCYVAVLKKPKKAKKHGAVLQSSKFVYQKAVDLLLLQIFEKKTKIWESRYSAHKCLYPYLQQFGQQKCKYSFKRQIARPFFTFLKKYDLTAAVHFLKLNQWNELNTDTHF